MDSFLEGQDNWHWCCLHRFNLEMKTWLKLDTAPQLLLNAIDICKYGRTHKGKGRLKAVESDIPFVTILQEHAIRWNGSYRVLKSLLANKERIMDLMEDPSIVGGTNPPFTPWNEGNWEEFQKLVDVLSKCADFMDQFQSREFGTASMFLVELAGLILDLEENPAYQFDVKALSYSLYHRFMIQESPQSRRKLIIAGMLDPRAAAKIERALQYLYRTGNKLTKKYGGSEGDEGEDAGKEGDEDGDVGKEDDEGDEKRRTYQNMKGQCMLLLLR